MAARKRDYKAEYRRRLKLGRLRGETVKEARGHRGDRTKAQRAAETPVIKKGVEPTRVAQYLGSLKGDRNAVVIVRWGDGSQSVIGRGKAGRLRNYMRELAEEHGSIKDYMEGKYGVSVAGQVISVSIAWQ